MTEEQQQRRAEIARQNGGKSRGPVSSLGKHISSLNSLRTGAHIDALEEDLPESIALLSTDNRQSFVRLYQRHLRQFQPNSELERILVRHMAIELFQLERLIAMETRARQYLLDGTMADFPDLSNEDRALFCYESGLQRENLWRSFRQEKKAHQTAYSQYQKQLKQLQRDFPVAPEEPAVEQEPEPAEDPSPIAQIMAEIQFHREAVKNEPVALLPPWIAEVLQNEELMAELDARPGGASNPAKPPGT